MISKDIIGKYLLPFNKNTYLDWQTCRPFEDGTPPHIFYSPIVSKTFSTEVIATGQPDSSSGCVLIHIWQYEDDDEDSTADEQNHIYISIYFGIIENVFKTANRIIENIVLKSYSLKELLDKIKMSNWSVLIEFEGPCGDSNGDVDWDSQVWKDFEYRILSNFELRSSIWEKNKVCKFVCCNTKDECTLIIQNAIDFGGAKEIKIKNRNTFEEIILKK